MKNPFHNARVAAHCVLGYAHGMTRPLYVLDKPLEWFGDDESPIDLAVAPPSLETVLVDLLRAHKQAEDTSSNGKSNNGRSKRKRHVKEERSTKRLKPICKHRDTERRRP